MNRTKKLIRLSKSGIDYLDYHWGITSGCWNDAVGICGSGNGEFRCWAKSITQHFPKLYPNGFNPTYYPEALDSPKFLPKNPLLIGVGWVGDTIGYGLAHKEEIYGTIEACPWHTFLFLTKNPDRLVYWSPFPENCGVGYSITTCGALATALVYMTMVEAKIKFLSFEPLMEKVPLRERDLRLMKVNWLIIGSQTQPVRHPKREWVDQIIEAGDTAGIPIFVKPPLSEHYGINRQELPK